MKSSYDTHKNLELLRKTDSYLYLAEGKSLDKLRKNESYKTAVGGFFTWEEYLKQPEINLSASTANTMILAYNLICLSLGKTLEEGSVYPISGIRFACKRYKEGELTKEEAINILEASKELSFKDLKEFYQDARTQDPARTYEYVVMRRTKETNNLTKVHDIGSEQIKTAFNLE